MLYRSTDRLCRCGAPVQYLSHSASFHSLEKYAPPNAGTKHLVQAKDPEQVVRRGPTSKKEYQLNISSVLRCGSNCAPLMSVSTEIIHSRAEGLRHRNG